MDLGIADHLLAGILAAVLPIFGVLEHRRLEAAIDTGVSNARVQAYRLTMTVEWGLLLAAVAVWLTSGRSLSALGLGFESGPRWWLGVALTLAACALLVTQVVVVLRSRDGLQSTREQLGSMEAMIPHDEREGRTFAALSVTAGICEELLYRGFLIAYFAAIFGTWPAVALSSLVFGLAHSYQGPLGFAKTAGVGLVMAGLYLLTGSLWAPMLLHVFVDLTSGYLARRAVEAIAAPG
jgi:membrane protease YdiL (CAAX protease family)